MFAPIMRGFKKARIFLAILATALIAGTMAVPSGAVPSNVSNPIAAIDDVEELPVIERSEGNNGSEEANTEESGIGDTNAPETSVVAPQEGNPADNAENLELSPELEDSTSVDTALDAGLDALQFSPFQTLDISEPHLRWEVKDASGEHVGGTSVLVAGPRPQNGGSNWPNSTVVRDCVDDCAGMIDRDPKPGYFAVTHLNVATGATPIIERSVYRIQPVDGSEPEGSDWVSTSWVEIERRGNTATNAAWPVGQPGYQFPDVQLVDLPSIAWEVKQGSENIGGAVITLESLVGASWTRSVRVEDCVEAPCATISIDQDPRPGLFKVNTIRQQSGSGFNVYPVQSGSRYRVQLTDAPVGYQSATSGWLSMGWNPSWENGVPYNIGAFELNDSSTIAWSVHDENGQGVGPATVRVEGPRSGNIWGAEYYVTDCTVAPCHPESMDQDPRPGEFKVDTLRGLESNGNTQTIVPVSANSRYRIARTGSIPGYTWQTGTNAIEIPGNNNNGTGWVGGDYTFNAPLRVQSGRAVSDLCVDPRFADSYYSLNRPSNYAARIVRLGHNEAETSISASTTNLGTSNYSLLGSNAQTANALGVTSTGVFYFTGQVGAGKNATVYRFDPDVDSNPYPLFNMDLLSPASGYIVSGDATIYQGREEYYFAYYSNSPDDVILDGRSAIRFHLYRYSHGNGDRTGEVQHVDVPRPQNLGLNSYNGDFAFDAQNNIQFIISDLDGDISSGVVNAADFQPFKSAHTLADVPSIQGTANYGYVQPGGVNGITYTSSGRAIIQHSASNRNRIVQMPSLNQVGNATQTFSGGSFVDLASCSVPTTVTVQKNLDGKRQNPDDQFTLEADRIAGTVTDTFTPVTTTGDESGIQEEQIGPFVVTLDGTFRAREEFTNDNSTDYKTTWACHAQDSYGNLGEPFATGDGTNLQFALSGTEVPPGVVPGANLVCIFDNATQQLGVAKTSNPGSGEVVSPGELVEFNLEFRNSGKIPAAVNHVDYLSDLLDDADFVDGSGAIVLAPVITAPNLTATWSAADKRILINGTIPASETYTVSYRVKVKPNWDNAKERESDGTENGYYLQNFVVPEGETPPEECVPEAGEDPTCTVHPVNAWTVFKDSRPVDGARLHAGGNTHYRLVAEKLNDSTLIDDLVFSDDLTNVFKTAGFAPDAAVPGGALSRGIYFFDSVGNTLAAVSSPSQNASINGDSTNPVAAYEGAAGAPDPQRANDRWTLTSNAVDVPRNAVRAELWFAVEAGHSMAIPGTWPDGVAPTNGATFTNYVTAHSESVQPNRCITGVDIPNSSLSTADSDFPVECRVTHELQDNYFTIRKDAQGPGVDAVNTWTTDNGETVVTDSSYGADITGMWNMIGHVFEIRDDNNGSPSNEPSIKLCRTDYNPRNGSNWVNDDWVAGSLPAWDGSFHAAEGSDTYDYDESSATLQAIHSWNNAHPDDQLPLCGLIYEQGDIDDLASSTAGGQTGRWRSENLESGNYWLVETKAPTHQINTAGTQKRPVPGIQLLAQPIPFTVWGAEADPNPNGQSQHGLGQLDVSHSGDFDSPEWLARCSPGGGVGDRPTACVNPTGYLMLVKDVTTIGLPFAGGQWTAMVMMSGLVLLVMSGVGIFWWRRRE